MSKLYTVVDAYDESDYYTETSEGGHEFEWRKPAVCPHPDEWIEFSLSRHGEVVPFYLPATGRIYRSRSGAIARRDLIRYWGGKAEVLVCEPAWESLEAAAARRESEKWAAKIARKRAELGELVKQRDAALGL